MTSADMLKNLEAPEMWFIRKMLRISYAEYVTNEDILRRAHTNRNI